MARCFAVDISQAPGLSGMPEPGHCSRAATRASWANSSAMPTSRTMRVSPAMMRADSMRQTASMARWVSVEVTATHHTIFKTIAQDWAAQTKQTQDRSCRVGVQRCCTPTGETTLKGGLYRLGFALGEVFGAEHLADFGFAFPAGPMFLVKLHEGDGALDGLLLGIQLELRVAADNLLGFREGPVDHGYLPAGKLDTGT